MPEQVTSQQQQQLRGKQPNLQANVTSSARIGSIASTNKQSETQITNEQNRFDKSPLYLAFINVLSFFLYLVFFISLVAFLLVLDFLDIIQFRYKIPEKFREKWPLRSYYDFVRLHQLPNEERYQELIRRKYKEYTELLAKVQNQLENKNLELEKSYQELIKKHDELYKKRHKELDAIEQELLKQKSELEELRKNLENKQNALDAIAKRLASEAVSIQSSLIRFMDNENRLKQVQNIAANMNPRNMANILNEVSDNNLIYDILKGLPPESAANILNFMDPEKAGKVLKIAKNPPILPEPYPYSQTNLILPNIQDLLASYTLQNSLPNQ